MKKHARAVRSVLGLAWRFSYAWWPHVFALAVSSGIVVATIAGALGVGDAMQRGLLEIALSRLGDIDTAVVASRPFRNRLARELAECVEAEAVVPAMIMEVSVEAPATEQRSRAISRATLLASDQLSSLGFGYSPRLTSNAVSINSSLSEMLGIKSGEPVILRMVDRSAIPGDSSLGRRTLATKSRRLRVQTILPKKSLGDFSIHPTQVTGGLVVASLAEVQSLLRKNNITNVMFCTANKTEREYALGNDSVFQQVKKCLTPKLSDYGLSLVRASNGANGPTTIRLVSEQLLLDRDVDQVAEKLLRPLGGQRSFVFLANVLSPKNSKSMIPYSTVVGINTVVHPVGSLVGDGGEPLELPSDGEIVIDRWMADDLAAQGTPVGTGDIIEVTTFRPETLHGRVEEQVTTLRITGIAAMQGAAVAREIVPEVDGITDEKSIADWDPPFPFDESLVRATPPNDQDEQYWKEFGASPKAFVSLGTAREIAASRFGETTAWHLPADQPVDLEKLENAFAQSLAEKKPGFQVVPLARRAVAAARGSTPFGGLFIGLSSVVVIAGLVLEWLLFGLIVKAHYRDAGVLLALGWPEPRLSRLLLYVGGIAILGGVLLGTLVAPIWSITLIEWLGRSWNAAVAAGSQQIFFAAYPRLSAMWPGIVCAAAISFAAIWWAAHRASGVVPLRLLRDGDTRPWLSRTFRYRVIRSIGELACRSIYFRRSRSFAVIFIVALAEFLIVVVSAFSLKLSDQPDDRQSPTGGWTYVASFGEPNGISTGNPDALASLGLSTEEQIVLDACVIERIRSNGGDDASCTNLYATTRPRVLGVSPTFIKRGGFRFVSHASLSPGTTSPWALLNAEVEQGECIPVVLD
ncbi:MAG: ABC transporter permease, partial [Pirellulales bacterium]